MPNRHRESAAELLAMSAAELAALPHCDSCEGPADHVPSDDPPGADSSPMSELQRNAYADRPIWHRMTIGMGNLCGAPTVPNGGNATTFAGAVTCLACIELRPHADFDGQMCPPQSLADHTGSAIEKILGA